MDNAEERERFARGVAVADLKPSRLGSWTWTPQQPFPTMEKLLTARFWNLEQFVELRQSFAEPRPGAEIRISPGAEVAEITVPVEGGDPRRIIAYKGSGDIPPTAMALPVLLVVIHTLTQTHSEAHECPPLIRPTGYAIADVW